MEKKIRYTLGKKERLKSQKAIDLLFKKGNSFSIFPFRVLYLLKEEQSLLIEKAPFEPGTKLLAGFTVSSRNFKRAVDRNHIKRLMKEAYRLQKNELRHLQESGKYILHIFFIYTGKERPQYKWIYEKIASVLHRLIKLTSEKRH